MKKREFIKISLLAATAAALPNWAIATNEINDFVLPVLPYSFDALEPHIDKATMEIHYSKHHAAYIKNLNEAIKGTKFEKMSIEQILENITEKDTKIRNNAGGHYNHSLFWQYLSPNGGNPTGKLEATLQKSFGSFDAFKTAFDAAAKSVFGSGWVWLIQTKKSLEIITTANQDNPLMTKVQKKIGKPLLALDVWEHAYYLKHQNKRADYINAFWNVVNWKKISESYV